MTNALTILDATIFGGEAVVKIRSPRLQPGVQESPPNFTSPLKRAAERAARNLSPAKAGSQILATPRIPPAEAGGYGSCAGFAGDHTGTRNRESTTVGTATG
jgi:hypothetical protein